MEFRIGMLVGQSGLMAVSVLWVTGPVQSQVLQDLLDDVRVFDRCNDPDRPTALFAFLTKKYWATSYQYHCH